MSEFNIEVQGGSSVRLPTAGKYCDRDIIVTASGGGGTEEIENLIDQSGVLDSTDGTATEKVEQLIDLAKGEDEQYEDLKKYVSNLRFNNASPNVKTIHLDCSKFTSLTSLEGTFNRNFYVRNVYLSNTEKITTWSGCFYTTNALEHIYGDLDFSSTTNVSNAFQASVLKTISIVPNTIKVSIAFNSPKLTDGTNGTFNSIQSIINGLADLTGGTAQTLTLNATVKAKLTEEQLATITSKNWSVA